jgi:hypothetical protein
MEVRSYCRLASSVHSHVFLQEKGGVTLHCIKERYALLCHVCRVPLLQTKPNECAQDSDRGVQFVPSCPNECPRNNPRVVIKLYPESLDGHLATTS